MPCRGSFEDQLADGFYAEPELERVRILLCSACRALRDKEYDFGLNPALDKWWDEHKKQDAIREAKEIKEKLERAEAKRIAETKTIVQMSVEEKQLLKRYNFI